jgi:hypothetical protein
LTVTKYPYIKWQWIFSFLRKCGLSSITDKPFTGLEYMSNTVGVSSEAEPTSPSPPHDFIPGFFYWKTRILEIYFKAK